MGTVVMTPPDAPASLDTFTEFYETTYGRVVAALRVDGLRRDLAEDVAQEAYARTFPHWDRVVAGSSPLGYVLTAAFRLKRRMFVRTMLPMRFLRAASSAEAEALASIQLRRAVASLTRRQRQCLALVAGAGLTDAQAGAVLGISESAVRSHTSSARAIVEREMATERN